MKKHITIFCILVIVISCSQDKSTLSVDEFRNPSTEYRPLALWSWMNGYIDTAKLVYEIEQMKEKGMRGAILWDLAALYNPDDMIPAGPPFLGPESKKYISIVMKNGHELGLDMGMAVSSSWNAGGEWIGPENAIKEILLTSRVIKGPGKLNIKIDPPGDRRGKTPEHYSLISSVAMPHTGSNLIDEGIDGAVSLDKYTADDESILWDIPAGTWEVFSFFSCNTMQPLVIPSPNSVGLMIDHLSYEATKTHFDSLFSRIPKDLLEDRLIKFMEIDSYEVHRMKDWSPQLVSKFKEKYNYDPIPYIPLLLGYDLKDSVRAARFRNDYSILVSDMMVEGHFAQSVEIAEKYGIEMVTEAGHGGSPRVDPLKALGHSHIPTGEFWNRKQFWVTKEAASAAHIYDRKLVASESLTGWQHWQHGPSDYKQLTDIAFCEGLNQIMFHTFAHNPEVAGLPGFTYHAGEHLNVNTTWWEMAKPFMDYLARCSYMLRQGIFVADACLYYGDQAPNLVPPKRIDPNIPPPWGEGQCMHCGQPIPVDPGSAPGYDWDYMNAEIIVRDMEVLDGRLVLPSGMSYRVMLLPDREDISLEVIRKIEKLVNEGAVIIGRKPLRTNTLKNYPECDSEVVELADKIWGDSDGEKIRINNYGKGKVYWGMTLQEVLEDIGIPKDFEVKEIDNRDMHIDYIHRATESEDIYFISNSKQTNEKFSAVFRVDKNRKPEIWDAETGLVQRDVEFKKSANGIEIEFVMPPLGSRFVIFREGRVGADDPELKFDLQFAVTGDSKSILDLSSDWTVEFDPEWGGPGTEVFQNLKSWPENDIEGIRYFSGKALYTKKIRIEKEKLEKSKAVFIDFENIQETARINVNGKDCGIVWNKPYRVEISDYLTEGDNDFKIEVINTWNNRLVGDVMNPDEKQYTNTNIKNMFSHGNLLESGLIGEAIMIFVEN